MSRFTDWAAAGAVAAALAYGYQWYAKPADMPPGVTVIATTAPEVAEEPKVGVVAKSPIKVYQPGAKAKLKLPDATVWDNDAHVVASIQTPNDERQHTITTVINSETGESTTFDRVDPLPWIAVKTTNEVGVYAGLKQGAQALRIEGRKELLQIKALHVGGMLSADMAAGAGVDGSVWLGVWGRW